MATRLRLRARADPDVAVDGARDGGRLGTAAARRRADEGVVRLRVVRAVRAVAADIVEQAAGRPALVHRHAHGLAPGVAPVIPGIPVKLILYI